MKKYILALVIGLLTQTALYGHASTVTRKWCGGFFHRKFVAKAETSVLSYKTYRNGINCNNQYAGLFAYGNWFQKCKTESKGCSRPQIATCTFNSGNVYDYMYTYLNPSTCNPAISGISTYSIYARASHTTSGITLSQSATGRGSAGLQGEFMMDPDKLAALNDKGSSFGDVAGDIDITDDHQLSINNLSGKLNITPGADFYSTIKIVVIKENIKITDEEAFENEQRVQDGTYSDIVYSSQLSVTKNGIDSDGIFSKGVQSQQIKKYGSDLETGMKLENFSAEVPLEVSLADDEKLTVITILDGGFDISSAVVQNLSKTSLVNMSKQPSEIKIYPNPAQSFTEIQFHLAHHGIAAVRLIDRLGKTVLKKSERLDSGRQTIRLNTENLIQGTYIVEINSDGKISSQKLLISK